MLPVNTIGKVGVGRIRQASDEPIDEMFLLGSVVIALAWLSILFLREVPLRRSHQPTHAAAQVGSNGRR